MTLFILLLQIALAGEIKIGVNGMVCSFCANGIEKKFKAEAEVANIKVDLDNKQVLVTTKKQANLSDEKIKEIITASGYTITSIEREN